MAGVRRRHHTVPLRVARRVPPLEPAARARRRQRMHTPHRGAQAPRAARGAQVPRRQWRCDQRARPRPPPMAPRARRVTRHTHTAASEIDAGREPMPALRAMALRHEDRVCLSSDCRLSFQPGRSGSAVSICASARRRMVSTSIRRIRLCSPNSGGIMRRPDSDPAPWRTISSSEMVPSGKVQGQFPITGCTQRSASLASAKASSPP